MADPKPDPKPEEEKKPQPGTELIPEDQKPADDGTTAGEDETKADPKPKSK